MQGVDEFECQSVLVVDTHAGSAFALTSTLQAAGVDGVEAVQTLSGARERLNSGDDREVAALILSDRILCGARDQVFRGTIDMARTRGVALVLWRTGDVALDVSAFERAFDCRIAERLDPSMDGTAMASTLSALLAVQHERRRAARREAELERELAELRVMETRLQHLVYHDELTGLWNRRRLKEALEVSVLRAANLHRPCSLLLIDMDRFKLVNDLEGYDAGDRMLVEMSRLLRRHIGPADTVARIGSDEFALLLDNCGRDEAMERAATLRAEFESYRFYYRERCYRTCVTIGVAVMPPGERRVSTSELMAHADQACFVGKQHGRNRIHCYSDHDPELERLRLDHEWAPRIREALENDRLFFCFQPIVRLLDGVVTHYECLLRMRDRDGSVHLPGEFVPVAERTGLIHHLDMWVVDRALDVLSSLPPECAHASVSINLSGHAFRNWELLELLKRRLEMCWVSPTRLVVEITETAAIENMVRGREIVARLRALGVRFALDDFGSGFNTFNYLKQFPVDYLKLDGSFIVDIAEDRTDRELVRHMVAIARSLGKETIAEFVERRDVYEILHRLGVDYVQGHYLGRATEVPVAKVDVPLPGRRPRTDREELITDMLQDERGGPELISPLDGQPAPQASS